MLSSLAILLLAGTGAVLWSSEHKNAQAVRGDAPARLLQWAIGLLSADQVDWGQAMLGELDQLDSRSRRWRFGLGCVSTVVLLPPLGSVVPIAALVAVALASAVTFGIGFVHFGLATNPWNWVMLAILTVLVTGCIGAVSVLLRRPGVARRGLVSGTLVAAIWLTFSRFTFAGVINPMFSAGASSGLVLMIGLPLAVGVGSAWHSGSAVVGRRTARLAGISAGLVMFFIATIAVVAIRGGQRDPGAGLASGVSEAFFNVAMLFLVSLPLMTAGVGWVAATATAHLRYGELAGRIRGSLGGPSTTAAGGEEAGDERRSPPYSQ